MIRRPMGMGWQAGVGGFYIIVFVVVSYGYWRVRFRKLWHRHGGWSWNLVEIGLLLVGSERWVFDRDLLVESLDVEWRCLYWYSYNEDKSIPWKSVEQESSVTFVRDGT